MSKIKKEIERYMTGSSRSDSLVTTSFIFPADFIGFQGHFPTKKVLPGACQIQCALSSIEKVLKKPVALKEIILAKYSAPILPDDTMVCNVSGVPDSDHEFICTIRITKGTEKVTELKLRVSLGGTQ